MLRLSLFWLALVFACCGSANAPWPPGALPVDSYATYEFGTRQNYVFAQDSTGRLFVGSGSGVYLFDGERWQRLGHADLALRYCKDLRADGDRILALCAGDFGYFEETAGRWMYQSLGDLLPEKPTPDERFLRVLAGEGGDWIQSSRRLMFRTTDGRIAATNASGRSVMFAHGGHAYVNYANGLYRLRIEGDRVRGDRVDPHFTLWVVDAASTPTGVYLATADGLYRWRDGVLARLGGAGLSGFATSVRLLANGNIALGFTRGAPVEVDRDGNLVRRFPEFGAVVAHALFEDREGGLWVGQNLHVRRADLASGVTVFGIEKGIENADGLLRMGDRLYASTSAGLHVLDAKAEPARFLPTQPEVPASMSLAKVGDAMYVTTGRLVRIVPGDAVDAVTAIEVAGRPTPYHGALRRVVASRFHAGRAYVAGDGHGAIVDGLPDQPRWRIIEGLSGIGEQVVEADADTLWFSSSQQGPWRVALHPDGSPREVIAIDRGEATGSIHVQAGIRAPWFAASNGIFRFDETTGRLIRAALPAPADQDGSHFFRIFEEDNGYLWVRYERHVGRFEPTADGYRYNDRPLGSIGVERTVFDLLRDGQVLWIARSTDLLRFDERQSAALPAPAELVAQAIGPDGEPLDPAAVSLPYDARSLSLRFALPSFARSEATLYRSRLRGFDRAFSAASRSSERGYTNLPDGHYQFEVEATDAFGRRIELLEPLSIAAPAPWWRSSAARIGYAILAALLLWAVASIAARRRQRAMMERQRELEGIVEQRTAQLAEQNQTLEDQAQRLREIDQLKTRFFTNVGHEFRTPLSLVMGPLEDVLADTRARLSDRVRESLELAARNARRVLDLIVELLDVNRLEHGQLPMRMERIALSTFIERVVAQHRPLLERFGHRLRLAIAFDSDIEGIVDPLQIERAIGNLVTNAAKYTPRGGDVVVEAMVADLRLRLTVTDNGEGISAAQLPHIFDRYYRASEGDDGKGHGIGLALVREIVEGHGGQVSARSEPGQGASFTIELPLAPSSFVLADTPVGPPAAEDAPTPVPSLVAEKPLILIADDHDDLRLRLRRLLEAHYRVVEAADGPQALMAARNELPDLILSDVMMPGFDGVELSKRLRADADLAAIPLLLLTAKAGAEHAVAGLAAGADDYLSKPFDSSELLARIGALLAMRKRLRHRLLRELAAEPAAPEPQPEDRWRHKLESIIRQGLGDSSFTVDQIADAMHIDRTALFRRVKAQYGQSPSELLREARLKRAFELLSSRVGNVTEVAYAVGFESMSSFARAFRQRFGVAPSTVGRERAA